MIKKIKKLFSRKKFRLVGLETGVASILCEILGYEKYLEMCRKISNKKYN
jgi:hypothetical protein